MYRSLFGLEAELALCVMMDGNPIKVDQAVNALGRIAARKLTHLRGGGNRMFLANGSLFYVDCGHHPEVATPECTEPWEAVCHLRAAERMVSELAASLCEELGANEVLVGRCNVDYLTEATWGCHESYLSRLPVTRYQDWLIPHLVSRTIYTGCGGLDPQSPGIRFSLSPRAAHIAHVTSSESTSRRGIFHTRDESLCEGYNRLHVLVGDNACSQFSTLLKVGTTALVVALAEMRRNAFQKLTLKDPVNALKGFARDLAFRAAVELPDGTACSMSALEIQRHYLDAIEAHCNTSRLPDWASRVCKSWRRALYLLSSDAWMNSHLLDWTLKRQLFRREIGHHGFTWESVGVWSEILEKLYACWPDASSRPIHIDSARIDKLCIEHHDWARRVEESRRMLAMHTLTWSGLDAFTALRKQLCAIDVRFGAVGQGIFDTLDRQGRIPHHRTVTEREIAAAADEAPAASRASVRARWVKQLASRRDRYVCCWERIEGENTFLDLSDPFAIDARWARMEAA